MPALNRKSFIKTEPILSIHLKRILRRMEIKRRSKEAVDHLVQKRREGAMCDYLKGSLIPPP